VGFQDAPRILAAAHDVGIVRAGAASCASAVASASRTSEKSNANSVPAQFPAVSAADTIRECAERAQPADGPEPSRPASSSRIFKARDSCLRYVQRCGARSRWRGSAFPKGFGRFATIALRSFSLRRNVETAARILAEACLQQSYEAMLRTLVGLLLNHGAKPRSQPGHHIAIIEFVRSRIDTKHAPLLAVFDRLRRQRNMALYDALGFVSEHEAS
jgi:hypothetical protein